MPNDDVKFERKLMGEGGYQLIINVFTNDLINNVYEKRNLLI